MDPYITQPCLAELLCPQISGSPGLQKYPVDSNPAGHLPSGTEMLSQRHTRMATCHCRPWSYYVQLQVGCVWPLKGDRGSVTADR